MISRRVFTVAATTALFGASSRPADAQVVDPRPPTVDTSNPIEVADGVWVVRDHRIWLVPNVGIVLGRDTALVVDTGLGPANGERVLDLARRLAGSRMPHVVYDGAGTEIDLGGRTVRLQTWGTAHTRGDQVVFLPAERILFAGDLIEQGMFPIFPWFPPDDTDVDGLRWREVLRDFQRFAPKLVIPGHGDPGPIDIALDLASHIETVGRQVHELRAAGLSVDAIMRDLKPRLIAANPTWDHAGLIDWELAYFAAQPA